MLKFNLIDQSKPLIGPNLGNDPSKYLGGAEDGKGCIYCAPNTSDRILKIDTVNCTVALPGSILPEEGSRMWRKGVLVLDGNIYFMPADARRILKLDPRNDTVCLDGSSFSLLAVCTALNIE